MATVEFTKMHGAGNDYIYVDTTRFAIANPSATSIAWSDRHKGIGGDGLVLIGKSDVADFSMRIFNADGSEAQMCGNASRCIGRYVYEHGLTTKTEFTLQTGAGIKTIKLNLNNGKVDSVSVNMGRPMLHSAQQFAGETAEQIAANSLATYPVTVDGRTFNGRFVSMGNPHFVIFVDDIATLDISHFGPMIETNSVFPQKVNVEFAQVIDNQTIRMRVWERGSGITWACGTGACATATAAIVLMQRTSRQVIKMDGGDVIIDWAGDELTMTGPATEVFSGTIDE